MYTVVEANKGPMVQQFLSREIWSKSLIYYLGNGIEDWFICWDVAIAYSNPWESGFRVRHPLFG
jgi:hypothetical protein